MPDEMDRAQKLNEQFLADTLAEHRRNRPYGPSLTHCEDCGEKIPEARRRASPGCTKCIDCQNDAEYRRNL